MNSDLVPLTYGSDPLQAQSGNWQLAGQLLAGLQSFKTCHNHNQEFFRQRMFYEWFEKASKPVIVLAAGIFPGSIKIFKTVWKL